MNEIFEVTEQNTFPYLMPFPFPLPFDGKPHRWTMGLRPLALENWLWLDGRYDKEVALRRELLSQRRDEVFQACPEAQAASTEVLELVLVFLEKKHPERFQRIREDKSLAPGQTTFEMAVRALHPLELAGRLVQEDLCVMQAVPDDFEDAREYHLTAAALCFPTRWNLREKIGHPMSEIHDPVPGYREQINAPVNQFMRRLTPEKPMWRINWSLNEDSTLFQPGGHGVLEATPHLTSENAGTEVFLRLERQTLRRLPMTSAILFTIRILQCPLEELNDSEAHQLAQTLRYWPEDLRIYKSFPVYGPAVLSYLEGRA
ncbi:MAG: DUF3445 domain-containing protein [Deltaproteobacteria bacterium]|nr:DUF3445 domain-containing protein [Deltaproteobacteria bacterium]